MACLVGRGVGADPELNCWAGLEVGGTKCAASVGRGVVDPDWHPVIRNNRKIQKMVLTAFGQRLFIRGSCFIGFCFVVKFRLVQY